MNYEYLLWYIKKMLTYRILFKPLLNFTTKIKISFLLNIKYLAKLKIYFDFLFFLIFFFQIVNLKIFINI